MKLPGPELPELPELPCVAELDERGELVECAERFAEECVGVAEVAEGLGADDDAGAELLGSPEDAAEELDPAAAHAVNPVPPTTTAMITAETRLILMVLPSVK